MSFHKKVAKLVGVSDFRIRTFTEEELEKEILEKLEYQNAVNETNRRIEEQTAGMSDYEKQRYFDSWSGGGS